MKPTIYLTDPEAMRQARLNQPRVSSEQFHAQIEEVRRAAERYSEVAKKEISSRGLAKARS
jgi:hypothetical protein